MKGHTAESTVESSMTVPSVTGTLESCAHTAGKTQHPPQQLANRSKHPKSITILKSSSVIDTAMRTPKPYVMKE